MRNYLPVVSAVMFFISVGCGRNVVPSADMMAFEQVEYVKKFPRAYDLSGGVPLRLDLVGTVGIVSLDSLLIVSTNDKDGYWSFFSLPDYEYLGKYLREGNGPGEFLSNPWAHQHHFGLDSDGIYAIIYDFQTGGIYKMDITGTLKDKTLHIAKVPETLPPFLFDFTFISPGHYLCREVDADMTGQCRYILKDGIRTTTVSQEKLNKARVASGMDINCINTTVTVNPGRNRIVEIGQELNHISIHAPDDSFAKTVCVGSRIDNISVLQGLSADQTKRIYMTVRAHPRFFSTLYYNETYANIESDRFNNPTIQFFDWDGNPLAEIKLDRLITSYSIDLSSGILHTANYYNEDIYRYDIGHILNELESGR